MKHHKINERIEDVTLALEDEVTWENQLSLNRLDKEKGRYIEAAVKRFNRGIHDDPWSIP